MKKYIQLAFLLTIFSTGLFAQKIKQREVDEFTKNKVVRTSWETINADLKFTCSIRGAIINESYYLDFKIMMGMGGVFAVPDGESIMLLLDNDEVIEIINPEHIVSSTGAGATGIMGSGTHGVYLSCKVTEKQLRNIINSSIAKIRIYTTDGYVESEINNRKAKKADKIIELIIDE
ncbi:MAG: hypothetical protein ACQESN_10970 [Thermotogota bacterium]